MTKKPEKDALKQARTADLVEELHERTSVKSHSTAELVAELVRRVEGDGDDVQTSLAELLGKVDLDTLASACVQRSNEFTDVAEFVGELVKDGALRQDLMEDLAEKFEWLDTGHPVVKAAAEVAFTRDRPFVFGTAVQDLVRELRAVGINGRESPYFWR